MDKARIKNRKFIQVKCSSCKIQWQKRYDCMKQWSGLCFPCSRVKLSKEMIGMNNHFFGKKHNEVTIEKNRKFHIGKPSWNSGLKCPQMSERQMGEKNHMWIFDRDKLAPIHCHTDYQYKQWRRIVYKRDNYKCRIADNNCEGRIEAHHILRWADHVELRFNINNGITLCHAHHPFKRAEEKRLISIFQKLVSVSN